MPPTCLGRCGWSQVTIKLEVSGVRYSGFFEASLSTRLDALCKSFSFRIAAARGAPLPVRGGEKCKIIVDDEPAAVGHVELVRGEYDSTSHNIVLSGRDACGDILDSTLASLPDTSGKVSLADVIRGVVSHLGLPIVVTDDASAPGYNPSEETLSPEEGIGAWEYIERIARKRQVIITADRDGGIRIMRTPGVKVPSAAIQNTLGGIRNNVLSASFSHDTTGRYNAYVLASQLSPLAVNRSGGTPNATIVAQRASAVDDEIRSGRQMAILSELTSSDAELSRRAEWELNIRRSRGVTYFATVRGFRMYDGGPLWAVNSVVPVVDDFAGIKSDMLVNSVEFSYSLNGGSITKLGFVRPDSYALQLADSSGEIGAGLIR